MNATVIRLVLVCQLMDNDSRQVYKQKYSRLKTDTMLLVTSWRLRICFALLYNGPNAKGQNNEWAIVPEENEVSIRINISSL